MALDDYHLAGESRQMSAAELLSSALQSTFLRPHFAYGWDPRYDVKFLPVMRDLGWATAPQLRLAVAGRPLRWSWFTPDEARTEAWLESARRRRIVERNDDAEDEWGLTERGERGLPSVRLRELLPVVGLLLAAAGFAAADDRVELDLVLALLVLGVLLVLSPVLAAGGWQLAGRPLTYVAWKLESTGHGPS
jgi:hypothetical protein